MKNELQIEDVYFEINQGKKLIKLIEHIKLLGFDVEDEILYKYVNRDRGMGVCFYDGKLRIDYNHCLECDPISLKSVDLNVFNSLIVKYKNRVIKGDYVVMMNTSDSFLRIYHIKTKKDVIMFNSCNIGDYAKIEKSIYDKFKNLECVKLTYD